MLTTRQQVILFGIIRLYSLYGDPVGSKTLLKDLVLQVSPATVRNDMVVLEKSGLLEKNHTSSGRIPSEAGYRYYIDYLLSHQEEVLSEGLIPDSQPLEAVIHDARYDSLQTAKLSADLLASMTGYITLVFGQDQEQHYLEAFKLFLLDDDKVMVLVITDTGKVENEIYQLTFSMSVEDGQTLSQLLNAELQGLTLQEADQRLKLTLPLMIQRILGYQLDFSSVIQKMQAQLKGQHYFVSGKENIFDMVDPALGPEPVKQLYALIEGSPNLYQLLDSRDEGVRVIFGSDLEGDFLGHVNLLIGTYLQNQQRISLGILGPTRMQYRKSLSLLNFLLSQVQE